MTSRPESARTCETAILFTGDSSGCGSHMALGPPSILLPLHGKPMLQRAIERLVLHGCCHVHVILDEEAAEIRAFLQAGERWGCGISYHYRAALTTLAGFVRALDATGIGHCWLADATRVPSDPPPICDPATAAGHVLCWDEGGIRRWTGWGRFSRAWLLAQSLAHDPVSLERRVLNDERLLPIVMGEPLSAATPAELLASSTRMFATDTGGRLAIGRGSRIHPRARLVPPFRIGSNVKIAAGAVIGPNVAVESGAFVDKGAHVRDSIVMTDTYVGEELDVHDAIVRGGMLANTALETVAECHDPGLLAELLPPASARSLPPRVLAALLRLGLLPLYGLACWQTRHTRIPPPLPVTVPYPRLDRSEPGQTPVTLDLPSATADSESQRWLHHFCRTFYPGLREVARGTLGLVGPSLRSLDEVRRLPPEWRRIYAQARCGLLNETLLQDAAGRSAEDQFAGDALGAVNQDMLRPSLNLLSGYLGRVLREMSAALGVRIGSVGRPQHTDAV